jgi:DNA-binding transcriptional LysR family regulator
MELTEAGRALLGEAREILDRLALALATTRRTARGEQGRIVVGFTNSTPFHPFVPGVIRAFRDSHPRVAVVLEEGNGAELRDGLRTQRIDAAFFRFSRAVAQDLVLEPLLEERMVIALPAGHPLARPKGKATDKGLPLSALAGEAFIAFGQGGWLGLYEVIHAACHTAGFEPNIGQVAPRIISTPSLVAAGLGIAIIPASLQRLHLDGLTCRPIRGQPQVSAPILLVFRRGEASPSVLRFIDLTRRAAKAFGKDRPVGA